MISIAANTDPEKMDQVKAWTMFEPWPEESSRRLENDCDCDECGPASARKRQRHGQPRRLLCLLRPCSGSLRHRNTHHRSPPQPPSLRVQPSRSRRAEGLRRELRKTAQDPLGSRRLAARVGSQRGRRQAWSRRRWFDSDGLLQNARDARPVHLHAPLLLAVHPLLDSLIELLKLYKTVQK